MAAPAGAGAPMSTASAGQQGRALSGSPRSAIGAASAGQGPTPERAAAWEPPGTPSRSLPCPGSPGCAENPVGFGVGAPARDAAARPSASHMRPGVAPGPGNMGAGPEQADGLTRLLQAGEASRAGKLAGLKPVDASGSPFWAACGTKVWAGGDAGPILAPPAILQAKEDGLPGAAQCGSSALAREHSKVRIRAGAALQCSSAVPRRGRNRAVRPGIRRHVKQGDVLMCIPHQHAACCLFSQAQRVRHAKKD